MLASEKKSKLESSRADLDNFVNLDSLKLIRGIIVSFTWN